MQSPNAGFNPRMLLDPKGLDGSSRKPQDNQSQTSTLIKRPSTDSIEAMDTFTREEDARSLGDLEASEGFGQGSLIEKAYNVSHREERPQKRVKIDKAQDLEDEEKSKFHGVGGSGGDLAEYVKEKKKEGLQQQGPTNPIVVDLTNGESDFQSTVVSLADRMKVRMTKLLWWEKIKREKSVMAVLRARKCKLMRFLLRLPRPCSLPKIPGLP